VLDAGAAGVATQTPSFSAFPLSVTSGTYNNTFDTTLTSSFNSVLVTANGGGLPAQKLRCLLEWRPARPI
jgi:hypothetical protein